MKRHFKIISILGLAGFFLTSSMFCCCFTKMARAEEKPSCHQTHQASHSTSHDTKECDCDHSLAVLQTEKSFLPSFSVMDFLNMDQPILEVTPMVFDAQAYQGPPLYNDTTPLYIKHSILRI